MIKMFIFSGLIMGLLIFACNSGSERNKEKENQQNTKQLGQKLIIEDYDFAVMENNKFIPYNKAIYHRGDQVYMVLKNVGQFARDKDSLNHAEMKMEIFDAIGELITLRSGLFGAAGHANFENNILHAPYASYDTDDKDKIGKHTFKVTIYDIVTGDSSMVSDDFYIE